MSEHYIVTLNAGHLRIFEERQNPGQFTPTLQSVEALDFPAGRQAYTDRETDQAGRFGSSKHQSAGQGAPGAPGGSTTGRSGMSIDERLPMQREEARRRAKELAAEIDKFFGARPEATWDFAAGPELNGAVLEQISRPVRERIKRSVAKDLVNQRTDELRAHFSTVH
jgi:hypothetical protein